jgi:tetratricopeptide (TPR) repeat protein
MDAAGAADDRSAMQVVKADALEAAGQTRDAADAYLESLLRYPVTVRPEPDAQIARRLVKYGDALPDNRLLPALAEAWKLRAAGKFEAAAAQFRETATLSADRAWSAGMSFAAARALLDAARASSAGGLFRKVSEVADFPQADWAAGLAAAAYVLAGREDLAGEEVQRCRDLFAKSELAGDFAAVGKMLAERAGKPRTAEEAAAPAGGAGARLEAWPAMGLHLSFAPSRTPAGGTARLAVVRHEWWRLVLAPPEGGDVLLLDKVPEPLARLSFSPDGKRLAFLAGPEGKRSLYAVDLGGRQLLGDLKKLAAGRPDPATRAEDYRWPAGRSLPEAIAGRQ